MRNRDFHKKQAIKHASPTHWNIYKTERNKANVAMRNAKKIYFRDKINECSQSRDVKKSWNLINTLLNRNKKSTNVNELHINDSVVVDDKQIADAFNEYFVQIGPKLAAEVWGNCSKLLQDKLQKFQSRAARVITGASYDVRSTDILTTLSWETLDNRRKKSKAVFMYKVLNDRAFFKDFSVEGPTTKRDFTEKRKSGEGFLFGGSGVLEKCSFLGVLGPPPENFCIFELPRLDFLQFQHDFPSFSDKKGHY